MYITISQKGFTILEALIYIALFTFIIGGGVLAAYQIFEGSAQIQEMARRESEINFMLRKLDWLVSGADSGDILIAGGGSQLIVTKGGNQYTIDTDDGTLTMEKGGDIYNITNYSVDISSVTLTETTGTPVILTIEMTVNGEDIGPIIRYIR